MANGSSGGLFTLVFRGGSCFGSRDTTSRLITLTLRTPGYRPGSSPESSKAGTLRLHRRTSPDREIPMAGRLQPGGRSPRPPSDDWRAVAMRGPQRSRRRSREHRGRRDADGPSPALERARSWRVEHASLGSRGVAVLVEIDVDLPVLHMSPGVLASRGARRTPSAGVRQLRPRACVIRGRNARVARRARGRTASDAPSSDHWTR